MGPIEEDLREKFTPLLFGGGGDHSQILENPGP